MVSDVLERAKEEGEERWDDDFAEGISFSKLGTSPSSSAFFPLNLFFLWSFSLFFRLLVVMRMGYKELTMKLLFVL